MINIYENLLRRYVQNNGTEAPNGAKNFEITVRRFPNYSRALEFGIESNVIALYCIISSIPSISDIQPNSALDTRII